MGRARGKAKKHTTNSGIEEESGSGKEEKAYQKRGRPQKQVKDETKIQEEIEKADEEHRKNADGILLTSKDVKKQAAKESGKKRKRSSKAEGKSISTKEDGVVSKSKEEEDVSARKSVGLRQHGSRRKSTPRRAAEVGVECY